MKRILPVFKRKAVYIPLIIIILLVGGWVAYGAFKPKNYQTAQVSLIDFSQEVSVTGKVVAAEDVNLGFESGGRAASVNVKVGAKVRAGQLLASVASGDVYATVLDRQARLQAARARLTLLQKGVRDEELDISKTSKEQAANALRDSIASSYIAIDDAIRSDTDQFFRNPDSAKPDLLYSNDADDSDLIEDQRIEIRYFLKDWDPGNLTQAKNNLYFVRDYLNLMTTVPTSLEESGDATPAEISNAKAVLSSARSTINSAISSLNAAEKAWRSASEQLTLDQAGATSEDLEIERANVKSAEASLLQAQAELAKTSIVAPFEGTITKADLRIGELVSPNSPVISMISSANFEIESFIPEADIAKVHVGDNGTTTLDAYGDDIPFAVVITGIDLSDTEVDGVSTYKTTLQFTSFDDRIRSGMTANIDISSEGRTGVLAVPQTALVTKDGKRSVLVLNEKGKAVSREVKTGTIDSFGNIEITSGLSEGETVVTNPPKK